MKRDISRKKSKDNDLEQIIRTENASMLTKEEAYILLLQGYPDVLNMEQVSQILGVSMKTGYKLINEGKLRGLKVGRSFRIPKLNVLVYLGIWPEDHQEALHILGRR